MRLYILILGHILGFLEIWQSDGVIVLIQSIFQSCFGIGQPGKVAWELVGEASDVGQLLVVHITEPGHNFFLTFICSPYKGDNVGKGGEYQIQQKVQSEQKP